MKKTIALLLVALSLFCTSCSEVKNGETAVTPNPTIEAQEATPEEVVETYFEAWSEKSFEGMQSQVCMKLDELLLNFDIQKNVALVSCEQIEEYPYRDNYPVNIYSGRDDTKYELRDKYRPFYDTVYVKCIFNIEYDGEAPKKKYDMGVEHSYGLYGENGEHTYYAILVKAGSDGEWKIYDAPFFESFSEPVISDEKEEMTALEFTEKFMELYIKQDLLEMHKISIYPLGHFESSSMKEGATLSLVKVQTVEDFKAENPDIGGYSEEVPEYEGFYDVQNVMVTVNYENMLYEHENGEDTSIFTVGKSVQDNEWKVIYAFGNF